VNVALRRELADLREELASLRAGTGATGEAPRGPVEAKDLTPAQVDQVEHIWTEQYTTQLDAAFQGEAVDVAWSTQARATAQDALGFVEADGSKLTVDCRARLCRAEVTHHDATGPRKLVDRATSQLGWDGPSFGHTIRDAAGARTIVFLMKPGEEMPTPELTAQDVLAGL
jgi:hypothetical protein